MLLALDDNVEKASKKTAASVVGKLPIVHIEEKECTCSICLEDLEVGSFASEIPFCNHKFHTECIEKWLKDYGHTCPVCKQEVTEIDFNHAKIIKEEVNNKRKGFSNKNVTESRFKKKKVE
ncbi:predicted protein [Naegleria gruberi]|uniref:Predicted protein n=1 Tax=Naegleria gruberi TaxID=5762 RepID=D2W5G1_NAEGR|nr:uncharacterized protein NAEGRDRAFT_76653 [Naegleria gruberi]EFC35690.1 predicted protein [Naegleria gruberi]|eukprot:XP_002668434.1 predicted protein [Naegleria gruberi strain NEG-M]